MKQNKIYLEKLNGTKELLDELIGIENVIETDDSFEFTLDNQELIDSEIMIELINYQRTIKYINNELLGTFKNWSHWFFKIRNKDNLCLYQCDDFEIYIINKQIIYTFWTQNIDDQNITIESGNWMVKINGSNYWKEIKDTIYSHDRYLYQLENNKQHIKRYMEARS